MAPLPKRKRSTNQATSKKRARIEDSPEPTDDTEYRAKDILDENAKKYLIDWEPDPSTGKSFEPTWEPKEYANLQLVEAWEQQKAARAVAGHLESLEVATPKSSVRRRIRISRVVPEGSSAGATPSSTRQTRRSPTITPASSRRHSSRQQPSPHVHVEPREDFDPAEFERISQLPPSLSQNQAQETSESLHNEEGDEDVSSPSPSPRALEHTNVSNHIIPDTQSCRASASYVPPTQNVSGTDSTDAGTEAVSSYIVTPQEGTGSGSEVCLTYCNIQHLY